MPIVSPRRPQIGRSLAWHLLADTAAHRCHTGNSNIRWSHYSHFDFMPAEHPAMWNEACRTGFTKNNASKPIFFQTRPPRARNDTLLSSLAGVIKHAATQAGHFPAGNSRRKIVEKQNGQYLLAKTVSPIFWREIRAGKRPLQHCTNSRGHCQNQAQVRHPCTHEPHVQKIFLMTKSNSALRQSVRSA